MVSKARIKSIMREAKISSLNGIPLQSGYFINNTDKLGSSYDITIIVKSYVAGDINLNQATEQAYDYINQ